MSANVTLSIAGRRYTVACTPGEEAHIAALGASIDTKLAALPGVTGQSEPRTLLYAALLLADELHERQAAPVPTPAPPPAAAPQDEQTAIQLENMADRLEAIASQLEQAGSSA